MFQVFNSLVTHCLGLKKGEKTQIMFFGLWSIDFVLEILIP